MEILNLIQGTDEWVAHRKKSLNASDAPAMMGCSSYKTRDQLIAERDAGWRAKGLVSTAALAMMATDLAEFLGVAIALNLLFSIPLPVAFALAAVLSPTDAVAVSAISQNRLPTPLMHMLQGEALMNDASGLVTFKFALAAARPPSVNSLAVSTYSMPSRFGSLVPRMAITDSTRLPIKAAHAGVMVDVRALIRLAYLGGGSIFVG